MLFIIRTYIYTRILFIFENFYYAIKLCSKAKVSVTAYTSYNSHLRKLNRLETIRLRTQYC